MANVGRDELIANISHRMKSTEEMTRLLFAMEISKQPNSALRSWLSYLERSRINGKEE